MAQIPEHRCQTTALTTKPKLPHKAATLHNSHSVPLETLFNGEADKKPATHSAAVNHPACLLIVYTRGQHTVSEPGPLGPSGTRRAGAWRGPQPERRSSAIRRGPGSGRAPRRAARAGPSSPKWLPAPTKPAAAGPAPALPVTRPVWIHWRRRPGRPHRLNPCGSAPQPAGTQQKACSTSPVTLLKRLTWPEKALPVLAIKLNPDILLFITNTWMPKRPQLIITKSQGSQAPQM